MFKKITCLAMLCAFQFTSIGQCGVNFSTQSSTVGSYGVDITVSGVSSSAYSVAVQWGDMGAPSLGFGNQYSHTYANPGTYEICIDYIATFDGCYQQVCKSFTISSIPNLCPLTVTPTLSGNTLTLAATGSNATDPYLAFFYDIWAYVADPFNFSLIENHFGHSNTFSHTYPSTAGQSYTYCVEYGDSNDPASCEANAYCATISFGPGLGINEKSNVTEVQIYPVPATNYLNISLEEELIGRTEYVIYNLHGDAVFSGTIQSKTTTLLLPSDMISGKYLIKIVGENSSRTLAFDKL